MANNEEEKLSQKKRQLKKIEQLKKQLKDEEAKLRSTYRKERNAQLIAMGVFFEICAREQSQEQNNEMRKAMRKVLKGRTLDLALAAVDRIEEEKKKVPPKEEISPEPPSQLPEAGASEESQDR